jgi:hypothetical protein
MRFSLILGLAIGVPAAALAARPPFALAQVSGGMWEITGAPGAQGPVQQCVSDILSLAQFEHRGKKCSRTVLSDKPGSTTISYSCGSAGFGRSQVDVVTPRSLTISTQGISDQLPFNYVIEARRVGDCTNPTSVIHH